MRISVLIPCHNAERWICHALRSVASQTYPAQEIIVVNDASTDATARIASQAGAEVVSIDRRQIAAARNAGAQAAQGEYLFFVDADTRINRTHIDEAITALEAGYSGGSARVAGPAGSRR